MSHLLGALLTAALAVSTFAHAGAVMLLLGSWQAGRRPRAPIGLAPTLYAAAGIAAWAVVGDPAPVTAVAVGLAATGWRIRIRSSFSVLGSFVFATAIQAAVIGACWVGWFIATVPVGPTTRTLMLVAFALLVLGVPARLIQMYESLNILCRKQWTRARTPLSPGSAVRSPKVSVHVPVHSEPPEVVNAALDSLAALRYPTFEVLVVDNNTSDADLWRPVQAHCLKLGSRFRFFHVARLPGAKAGALNFALRHTSPDAEIVAPLDCDYHVRPDFLERLIAYFDDDGLGFVQTPQDYRGWQNRPYLRLCYWEDRNYTKTLQLGRNEADASVLVGTMCLIRRQAVESAGGWAERCLTEDSELGTRIRALGYSSVYIDEPFGHGLLPETFAVYKRQRFRWTYGPVQELKRHFRLLLPSASPRHRPSTQPRRAITWRTGSIGSRSASAS